MVEEKKSIKRDNISILKEIVERKSKVVITTHQKPDADALGSSLALYLYLLKKGHAVTVITPTDYPDFLNWMPGNDHVVVYSNKTEGTVAGLIGEADIIFCLDFNTLGRINEMGVMVGESNAKKVLIDHHLEPESFADFSFCDFHAAATCELLYEVIALLGDEHLIDQSIANCLYSGIMTDTGNFRHPNVTKNVFNICAQLIDKGANTSYVASNIYDNSSVNRLKLLGHALKEKLVVLPEYKTAYISLTAEELKNFNSQNGDTEGLVNYALSVKGVKIAALFSEKSGFVKMSFRSTGDISVNEMARKYFNGGGHKNASGGQSDEALENIISLFVKILPEYTLSLEV